MTIIETHYFIDYENVHENGLVGCDSLKNTDHIHLLYTENAKNTSLDIFTNHGNAELHIMKVPTGNQSLDMHLISYLGYLIGINAKKRTEYVIVSGDTGYDLIFDFWKNEKNIKLSRREHIAARVENPKLPEKQKTPEKDNAAGRTKAAGKAKTAEKDKAAGKAKTAEKDKALLHNELQQILSRANVGSDVLAYVPSLVIKHLDDKNSKQVIYKSILQKFGQKKGLDVYNRIKKHLK